MKTKFVIVSCIALALLIFGVAAVIAVQSSASAAPVISPGAESENDTPFEFRISPERPRSVGSVDEAKVSQAVSLSVNKIVLNHYDVYYTSEGCILALHFTTEEKVDLSQTLMGLGLRDKYGDLVMTAGGSLWSFVYTQQQPDPIHQGPFTLWVVFESVDLDALAEVNGEAFASGVVESYVEVYLSDRPGLTYAGYDVLEDTSPFIQITNIQPFRSE